jgi:hypothetical protein
VTFHDLSFPPFHPLTLRLFSFKTEFKNVQESLGFSAGKGPQTVNVQTAQSRVWKAAW